MTTGDGRTQRRLDGTSAMLLLIGLACGALSYWLVTYREINVLIIVPSIVAATTGVTHLFKRRAPQVLPPTAASDRRIRTH